MKTPFAVAVVAMLTTILVQPSGLLRAAELNAQAPATTVKVTVHYKGQGTVDASHKLWVWIFDTPNIGPGSMPIDQLALDKNGAEAVFNGVSLGKVFVAVAFDQSGGMTGDAPPPSGSPIAIWMGKDGAPMAVTPGAAGSIVLTFDDSMRMP